MSGENVKRLFIFFVKISSVILETQRLIIRRFELSDATFIIELLNSPGWIRFINNKDIHTQADAVNYLQNGPLKSYSTYGFGHYCVVLKNSGASIGMCGIIKRDTLEDPDIGFAFLPQYNGKGYAREAAEAVLKYALTVLDIKKIVAITTPANTNSLKLIDKLKMILEGEFILPAEAKKMLLFSISNELKPSLP